MMIYGMLIRINISNIMNKEITTNFNINLKTTLKCNRIKIIKYTIQKKQSYYVIREILRNPYNNLNAI